jgi:hypothetical protein
MRVYDWVHDWVQDMMSWNGFVVGAVSAAWGMHLCCGPSTLLFATVTWCGSTGLQDNMMLLQLAGAVVLTGCITVHKCNLLSQSCTLAPSGAHLQPTS